MFKLEIATDNAAFGDDSDDDRNEEVARILEHIARRLKQGVEQGKCIDANGNSVGEWGFE